MARKLHNLFFTLVNQGSQPILTEALFMYRNRIPLVLLGLLLMLGAFVFQVRAQAVYGSISGTVTDAAGAVVSGATVTITSIERKTSDVVSTNESGLYVKERLLPGNYEVKVEATGFKQNLVSSVVVNVDAQTKVDAALQAGAVSDTVTLTLLLPLKQNRLRIFRSLIATSPSSFCLRRAPSNKRGSTRQAKTRKAQYKQ
jgi:hypothetical protein